MTPTEQAADRVKALVDQLRIGADDWGDDQLMDQAADALTALQARVGELEGALKPFAAFAQDNTEADPSSPGYGIWSGNRCEGERIRDWFGPTDFHRAALLTPPLEQE